MINILIIDDEEAAGNILKAFIGKYIDAETNTHYCSSVREALEMLPSFKPSLIMLDIEMPGLSGFDFLNMSADNNFDVIFTTAYDQYAIKAIRFSALDYLLKPIDKIDLQNAVNRHIIKQQKQDQGPLVSNLITNLQLKDATNFKLALSTTEGIFFYEPAEILYCEAQSNYTRFVFNRNKPMLVSKNLGEYDELLNEYGFLRIHKSYLVNSKYVMSIDKDDMLLMSDGKQFPISKRRKESVIKALRRS